MVLAVESTTSLLPFARNAHRLSEIAKCPGEGTRFSCRTLANFAARAAKEWPRWRSLR